MTEKQLRNKVVAVAKLDSGAKQYSARHQKIIDDFNSIPGMGSWMTTKYAWCAATVSVWGWRAGLGDIFYPSASCNTMIALYKKHGRWMENDAYVPTTGDIVMYDWNDNGYGGDNKNEADHVGLVVSVSNGFITVIEGNKQNQVGVRTFPVNWRYIRGFCLPDYASKADKAEDSTTNWSKALQEALNASYGINLAVDGDVGPKTKRQIDIHYLWYCRSAVIVNEHVKWLQRALNALGADLVVDGSFGPATHEALKRIQKKLGIEADGYAGIQTHVAILKELS